jgi:wyosine [tRNA(Phe)-imidazoG37] synthetase (radical SAM superfamily)
MFVKGVNDAPEELEKLRKVLDAISAEKIQLNTITRPPRDKTAEPLEASRLARINQILGNRCEVICGFDKRSEALGMDDWVASVLDILERRALTIDDVVSVTGIGRDEAAERLKRLEEQQRLRIVQQDGTLYYAQKEISE